MTCASVRGEELGYLPLGMLPDETFEVYREAPGTLEERPTLRFVLAWVQAEVRFPCCEPFFSDPIFEVYGGGVSGSGQKMRARVAGGLPTSRTKTRLKKSSLSAAVFRA